MRSGELDRRITIRRKMDVENTYGEMVSTWTDIVTVWAKKTDLRGAERYAAAQTVGGTECKFKIRYRRDVRTTDRLVCGGKTYEITGIVELGRRDALEIMASGE